MFESINEVELCGNIFDHLNRRGDRHSALSTSESKKSIAKQITLAQINNKIFLHVIKIVV